MYVGWLLLWSIVLILLVLVPIVVVFRREARLGPEEILKRRYARGEISREDYLRMLADIGGQPRDTSSEP